MASKKQPLWQRKIGAKLMRHVAETCSGSPTLWKLKNNLAHQRDHGIPCRSCEKIARKLGF